MIENGIREILATYDDPEREGLQKTPERVAKVYRELLTSEEPRLTIFDSQGYDEMISDVGIEYYTFCEHHVLPFFGEVTIAYIPNHKIIGLSKLARIVDYFSKRLNTQEYFTNNIANYIMEKLQPRGVAVKVTGRHLCKEMRGAKSKGVMKTISLKGLFLEKPSVKEEFLSL